MGTASLLNKVNLFVGTAGDHGQLYPAAEVPFGLVKLGPDTYPGAVTGTAHAGYDFDDTQILGFSHLRFGGVGNRGIGGNILVQPMLRDDAVTPEAYAAPFDKDSEQAAPGYYTAVLEGGIRAELTATTHVGVHRYTFPESSQPRLLIDMMRGFTSVRDAHCMVMNNGEITGEFTSRQMPPSGWFRIFFCIQFNRDAEQIRLYPEEPGRPGSIRSNTVDGGLVAVAGFKGTGDGPLMVKVGLSSISVAQARRNLEAEAPGWDFEGVRSRCEEAWADVLGRIEVHGDPMHEELFYTHLYRASNSPYDITSSDGTYMGDDGLVRKAEGRQHYHGWSLWDTYRTKFPLLALTEPLRMGDMMQALTLTLTQRLDEVPPELWFDGHGFAPVPNIRHELANVVLADALVKDVPFHDAEATYALMLALSEREWAGSRDALGFVPRRPDLTCEYAYDAWAAASVAKALGKEADCERLLARAANYRNAYDPSVGFYRARDEQGAWLDFPKDPSVVEEKYVYEGSAWHWRWAVVHDIAGAVEAMGGADRFVADLNHFFENDLHNHGNEPGIHAPWLYAAAGAPWLSQKWVRRVLTEPMTQRYGTHGFLPEPSHTPIYRNTPDGFILEMDDDDGCMTAWYVFSSLGLFPLCPGRPLYALGAPLFEEAVIHNQRGEDFRIVAKGSPANMPYIHTAKLNGKEWSQAAVSHGDVLKGGVLEVELSGEPNPSWGADGLSLW